MFEHCSTEPIGWCQCNDDNEPFLDMFVLCKCFINNGWLSICVVSSARSLLFQHVVFHEFFSLLNVDLQVYHHAPKNHCGFLMLFLFHVAGFLLYKTFHSIRPSQDFHETAAAVSPLFFPQATARTPEDHSTVRYDVKQKCASGAQQTFNKMGISAYLSTGKTVAMHL